MHADDATRELEPRGERRDRQRGRVRCEDRRRRDDLLELPQQRALLGEILDDRLDDEAGAYAVAERVDRDDARIRRLGLRLVELALRGEPGQRLRDRGARLLGGPEPRVEEPHRMSGLRGDLRDAAAHRAGADDGDRRVACQRGRHCLAPSAR